MKRHALLTAVAAASFAALPAAANADLYCPQQVSIFGTVTAVRGSMITLRTRSSIGSIHVLMHRPQVNAHGLTLRPGVFAGVYGCLEQGGRTFDADEVTLAPSADAYASYSRREVMLDGRITSVQNGRVLVSTIGGHGDVWVSTTQQGLRPGEHVHVTGSFDPHEGAFVASGIAIAH